MLTSARGFAIQTLAAPLLRRPVRRVPGVAVPAATRPPGYPAPLPRDLLTGGPRSPIYGWPYRLPVMSILIPAAEALAILRAAGVNAQKSPARGRCRTLCYLVAGQYVNLGRLRQLAREALPAPSPALPGEGRPTPAPEPLAQVEVDPYKRGEWQRTGIGPDPVAVAERRAARWAERNPEHSYRVVPVPARPVLPSETEPPAPVAQDGPAPELPRLRADVWAGQPWDPGTSEARALVALQGERAVTLWPIAQAVRGAGFELPPVWWADGPILAGERTYGEALAALPLGAIAAAAAALAALPPVTAAQDRALRLCRGDLAAV